MAYEGRGDIQIVCMSYVIHTDAFELFSAITDDLTHHTIDPYQAPRRTHQAHSDVGILEGQTEALLAFMQHLLPPLAVGDVVPYALNEFFAPNGNSPAAYQNIPCLAILCRIFRFKGIAPPLNDVLDVLRDFVGRLEDLKVGYPELFEFLARITKVLVCFVVELQQRSGLPINKHNGFRRLIEKGAKSLLRFPQRLLGPLALHHIRQNLPHDP